MYKKLLINIAFVSLFLIICLLNINLIYPNEGISVGSKNFTESKIIAEIYFQAIKNAGYKANKRLNIGGTLIAHESLKKGEIDMYPEYTGTAFINILHHKPISDKAKVFKLVSQSYADKWSLIWLNPSSANNSQGIVVTKQIAEKYNLYKLSKLKEIANDLKMASIPEFEEREDGLIGLNKTYGTLKFKSLKLYDSGLKYRILLCDKADVTVGGTTDAELTDKNLVLLKDDKNFWPSYNIAPVVRRETLTKYPKLKNILNNISKELTTKELQKMNTEVDINKRPYEEVAKEFLVKHGFKKV